jgi:glycosyltransferase involved in cell wall biosynthesis
LKKHQIDVFFSPDGFLSLTSDVPQVGVIHDLNFEHYPLDLPASPRKYLRTYFPKFAKKAKFLLTVSHFSKSDIVSTYGINPEKIEVIWNGVNEKYHPISNEEKLAVKQKWTNGKDYFIFVGALHKRKNLVTLLKAFEQFQTKNKDIDLVIVGTQLWKNDNQSLPQISDELKKRIHFTGHLSLDELTQVMAAAYALTFVSYFEGFGIPLAEAMACGVPVIAGNRTSLPEVVGDAGILVDPFSVEEITAALVRISEDTQLYEDLSQKGLERSKLFSWDKAAEKVMEVIVR